MIMQFNTSILYSIILALLLFSGCSNAPVQQTVKSDDPFHALEELVVKQELEDARYQHIAGYDYFFINLPLRYQLQHYQELPNLQEKKKFVTNVIRQSKEVGEDAMELYLTRLTANQLKQFATDHQGQPADINGLLSNYQQNALQAETAEVARVNNFTTDSDLDQYWQSFVANIEESIMTKDRLKRRLETFLAVPFIEAWISYHEATDYRGALKPDFKNYEIYSLSLDENRAGNISEANWKLLQHFAPVIVHEVNPDASYSIENDRFGTVYLTGSKHAELVPLVDTTKPVVYAYIDHKNIQGHDVKQLVYTFFHPAHPQLSNSDPEAGPFDGWTIRVTLDQSNQPLDFESVSNCGCYYKNYPTDQLEFMASKSFSSKLKDKNFYVENAVDGKYDAVIPELVTDIDSSQANNIVAYYSAGYHHLITIRSKLHAELLNQTSPVKNYQLHNYEELENLPFNGHLASLFGTDGLVIGADRPECSLLKPSGVYHAGHPRQRETQMIYFDEAQFDDPELLETYLRLPPNAFAEKNLVISGD